MRLGRAGSLPPGRTRGARSGAGGRCRAARAPGSDPGASRRMPAKGCCPSSRRTRPTGRCRDARAASRCPPRDPRSCSPGAPRTGCSCRSRAGRAARCATSSDRSSGGRTVRCRRPGRRAGRRAACRAGCRTPRNGSCGASRPRDTRSGTASSGERDRAGGFSYICRSRACHASRHGSSYCVPG